MQRPIRAAVFENEARAEAAVRGLLDAGFAKDAVSVICPQCEAPLHPDVEHEDPAGDNTAEAAATGGAIGAVLGGVGAALGLAASGGTALVAFGPILGATAAGAVSGGFVGAMATRGFEPEIADFYSQALSRGDILVAVEDDDEARLDRAEQVFEAAGKRPIELRKG